MAIDNYPAPRLPISNAMWRYNAVGGETTLSGYDSFGQPLQYTVNSEQFFLNGVMLVRTADYAATTGTTITGLTVLSAGDFVEILTYSNFNIATLPATQITGNVQNNQLQNNSITLGSTTLPLGTTSTSISGLTIDGSTNIIRTNRGATNPTSNQVAGDIFWNTTSSALQLWNGTAWVSFAAPGSPTIGTATDVGTSRAYNNAAASISFTPNAGGGNATQYFITSTPGSLTAYGNSSPITLAGLSSSTQYTFTASAVGSFGNSPASNPTGALTVTSVPQAPTIGTATASVFAASVAFTAGATGGSAISYYIATSNPGGITASGTSSPINVTGLTGGNAYTFTVTATNTNGTSLSSAGSNSVTPTSPPVITGGTLSSDSTYYYRTFTGNGTLSVASTSLAVDIMVVAGGGGGGRYGGGGGAGGLLYTSSQTLPVNSYSATIGPGGNGWVGDAQSGGQANNGTASSFVGGAVNLSATGGGGGGCYTNNNNTSIAGAAGGSGGGCGMVNASGAAGITRGGGTGVSGQGFAGGNTAGAIQASYNRGGGGGGAGAAGADGGTTGGTIGAGGVGSAAYTSWGIATTTGHLVSGIYYYAGGGSAATTSGSTTLAGGNGGGGSGPYPNLASISASLVDGLPNTGGGGGGNPDDYIGGVTWRAGNGGSGIIIVRYTKASVGG